MEGSNGSRPRLGLHKQSLRRLQTRPTVHPLKGEDELQLGQLYLELPSYYLKSQLFADQMGALAVKASKALDVNGGRDRRGLGRSNWCGLIRRRIDPLKFICNEGDEVGYRSEGKRLVDHHTELWVTLEEENGDGDH